MEDLKRAVNEEREDIKVVKQDVLDNKSLIEKLYTETKQVTRVQRKEMEYMEECVKACQITIAHHDERLKAFENHAIRQNGLLEDLTHGIGTVTKKVDAISLEIANKFSEYERHAITRDVERDAAVAKALSEVNAALVTAKEKADADVDALRAEWLRSRIAFNWKLIAAASTIAFFMFIVILTVSLHIFGALPSV